jgi:hypothetical protein
VPFETTTESSSVEEEKYSVSRRIMNFGMAGTPED